MAAGASVKREKMPNPLQVCGKVVILQHLKRPGPRILPLLCVG